jgi:hypothetical protein
VAWILTTLRGLRVAAMNSGRMSVEEAGRSVGKTAAAAFAPVLVASSIG